MRRRKLLALALLAAAAPAAAQPAARLLPEGSEIVFTTRQMGVPVEGRFTRFSAEVALDARQPQAGRVVLLVDTASARFGAAELDSEVPQPIWLASAAFPQARFESTAIAAAGGGRFEVAGRLTIKGTTRELRVPVTLADDGAQTVAAGRFTLKRLDFRVGEAEWSDTALLADEVQVRFRLRLDGLPLPP